LRIANCELRITNYEQGTANSELRIADYELRTADLEYASLRAAIAARGQLRVGLAVAGVAAWALLLVLVIAWLPYPAAAVVPLVVLLAAFEAVRSLHMGAERLGRYLQVFYEEGEGEARPAWERTAMTLGPSVPGAGGHPLFLPVFLAATGINLLAVLLPEPVGVELVALAVPHLSFAGWLAWTDRAMRRQRGEDLARFRVLKETSGEASWAGRNP